MPLSTNNLKLRWKGTTRRSGAVRQSAGAADVTVNPAASGTANQWQTGDPAERRCG